MKKLLNILLALVLCFATLVGCKDDADASTAKITLSATELTLEIGEQAKLDATVEGSDEDVTWASSNANVARVNSFGQLQALALGTADVTATIGDVSAKCVVTVAPVLTASATDVTLIVPGDGVGVELSSAAVTFTGNPELAENENLTIVSSNESVAKYEDVVVTEATDDEPAVIEKRINAIAVGTAVITATAPNGAKATVNVKVEELNTQPTVLTFNITTAEEVPAYCGVFLVGSLTAWAPEADYELTRGADNKTFSGTFTFEFTEDFVDQSGQVGNAARNAEYKFLLASKFVEEDETITYGSDVGWEQVNGSNTDNRKTFVNKNETITVEGVVFQGVPANPDKPLVTNTINITLTFTEAVTHDVYLIGPFCDWAKDDTAKFTASADNKTFTLTVTYESKGTEFECKINDGTWDWNYGSSDGGVTWVSNGSDNCKAALTGDASSDNTRTVNLTWNIDNTPAA